MAPHRLALTFVTPEGHNMIWMAALGREETDLLAEADTLPRIACTRWESYCEWQASGPDGDVAARAFTLQTNEVKN